MEYYMYLCRRKAAARQLKPASLRSSCTFFAYRNTLNMANRDLNRLKVVLAEKKRTNRWLAEQLGKDQTTISKWCTNSSQPDLASLMMTAKVLNVELADLVRFEEFKNENDGTE